MYFLLLNGIYSNNSMARAHPWYMQPTSNCRIRYGSYRIGRSFLIFHTLLLLSFFFLSSSSSPPFSSSSASPSKDQYIPIHVSAFARLKSNCKAWVPIILSMWVKRKGERERECLWMMILLVKNWLPHLFLLSRGKCGVADAKWFAFNRMLYSY